jgi:5'-3' exonuclease
MEQQRTRRYKSWFESILVNRMESKAPLDPKKTTSMFTPGTPFMKKLSQFMKTRFRKRYFEGKYGVKHLIVATPDEPGEGEHKLFAHMREHPTDGPCAVYGLDADLLMLGLFHLTQCPQMYIFRESPQFAQKLLEKTKNDTVKPDEPLFIDVARMGRSIAQEMRVSAPDPHRMYDYVFMCFFLGNDFLPHFPSLNIRTGGIDALMTTYRNVIGSTNQRFLLSKTNPPTIQWSEVSRFVHALAKHEHNFWCQEYATRKKWDNKPVDLQPKRTPKERMDLFNNTPVLYRQEEKYINPHEAGWETRYYDCLFPPDCSREGIARNYLEGLEWVYQYYIQGKVNWTWKYNYHYPPLLVDLAPLIPKKGTVKWLSPESTQPVSPYAQLAYVLPPGYHHLLPEKIRKDETYRQYCGGYETAPNGLPKLDFQWAFCRYFWECHVHLPEIPYSLLQVWSQMT